MGHAGAAKVATGLLKDVVGNVYLVVLRMDDLKARTEMVEAMVAEAAIAPKTAEEDAEEGSGRILSMVRMKLWRERSIKHSRIVLSFGVRDLTRIRPCIPQTEPQEGEAGGGL